MKKERKFNPSAIHLIFIFTICVLAGCFFYLKFLEGQYNSETRSVLKRETRQIKDSVETTVESRFERLSNVADFLKDGNDFDPQKYIARLQIINIGKDFERIGIADLQGMAYLPDGETYDISKKEYFETALEGSRYVSNISVGGDSKEEYLVFSSPIIEDETIIGIVFGLENVKTFRKAMNISNGLLVGKSCIVDNYGNIIIDNMFGSSSVRNARIMDYLYISGHDKSLGQLEGNYKYGYTNFAELEYDGDKKIFYAAHFSFQKWHLITMISQNAMSDFRDKTMFKSYVLIASFLILYLATVFLIMVLKEKNKRSIEKIAYVDSITGGNTFARFEILAKKQLQNINSKYAVVDLDVDRFKYINDIFGYEEGNEVIRYLSSEIEKILKEDEVFAHHRGDEFVLLLRAENQEGLILRLKELAKTAMNRNKDSGKNYDIYLSMGIYVVENNNMRVDVALDMAILAKKTIKGKHNMVCAVYDDNMKNRVLREQEIEGMMEKALKDEEFKVYYQPKYDAATCELAGAEALVRWYSNTSGIVFPNEFIPIFENNGFVTELDKYMFDHVCRDVRKWLDEGYEVVPVSVNLSQLQLYNTKFIEEYKGILDKYGISPEYVQLELTETTLFSKISTINKIIDELHGIGFKILMDDFGTGYSSLSMLKNVPIDILKLDKSFVDDIGESKGDIVVSTIVSLGQLLNMKIVAEGVETKEQFEFLRGIFCDQIQGYYFSRPIQESEYRLKMKKKVVEEESEKTLLKA